MPVNRRLKVLQVGKFYPPHKGGIETHLQVLCRELQNEIDLEVLVANDSSRHEESWEGRVKVTRMATRMNISSAPVCPRLPALIRRAKADIVHLHWPNPPAVLALFASGYRGPVVVSYHSDIVRQKLMGKGFAPFLRKLLRGSAAIMAASPQYIETSPVLQEYASRCHIIPYGIPFEKFVPRNKERIDQIRQTYGRRLTVSVGRLIYYKGFKHLIEAMSSVDGHLLIIGEGHLRGELDDQVKQLGLRNKVSLLGEVEDVSPYYHTADVFALASVARSEAFGIVQLEAMACGKPVVNTKLDSGVPWVSQDGVTGITVPPKDPVALAGAIMKLLDDADLRKQYGAAARLRVETEFSQDQMIARMLETYREVLRAPVAEQSILVNAPEVARASRP
jgi:rhamnosyl/mannosyltransferase